MKNYEKYEKLGEIRKKKGKTRKKHGKTKKQLGKTNTTRLLVLDYC